MRVAKIFSSFGTYVDPNIAVGDWFLTSNAKTRAYWDFTALTGAEDSSITSVSDLRGNGWTLTNNSGGFTPTVGYLQSELNTIYALKALTQSGTKQALFTSTAATNLLKNSVEVHLYVCLVDGQNSATNILCGTGNGGTKQFRITVNSTGNIVVNYAAQGTQSVLTSSGAVFKDGFTGFTLLRVIFDFGTDTISGMINGISITFSLTSGTAISAWDPSLFVSLSGFGIGGNVDSTAWTADTTNYKYILKAAVTDLLTDDQYLTVAASFLN